MFENLADHSRIWIYQADRNLSKDDQDHIAARMNQFIPGWAAHGNELYGGFEIREDHFLVVGVDESKSPPSGCSIDKLVRQIQMIGDELEIDFFNRLNIAYVNQQGEINLVDMQTFKEKLKRDEISRSTLVFNNLLEVKSDLKDRWKTPVANSWHKNLLIVQ